MIQRRRSHRCFVSDRRRATKSDSVTARLTGRITFKSSWHPICAVSDHDWPCQEHCQLASPEVGRDLDAMPHSGESDLWEMRVLSPVGFPGGAILDSGGSPAAFWRPKQSAGNFQQGLYFYTKLWYSIDRILLITGLLFLFYLPSPQWRRLLITLRQFLS